MKAYSIAITAVAIISLAQCVFLEIDRQDREALMKGITKCTLPTTRGLDLHVRMHLEPEGVFAVTCDHRVSFRSFITR